MKKLVFVFIIFIALLFSFSAHAARKQAKIDCSDLLALAGQGHIKKILASATLIPEKEKRKLLRKSRAAKDAKTREQLIEKLALADARFIFMKASEYSRRFDLPIEDLFLQGIRGNLEGLKRIDLKRKNNILTYTAHWIKARMYEYIYANIHIANLGATSSEAQKVHKYYSTAIDQLKQADIDPTNAAIAEQINKLSKNKKQVTEATVAALGPFLSSNAVELDKPLSADTTSTTMHDLLADESQAIDNAVEKKVFF